MTRPQAAGPEAPSPASGPAPASLPLRGGPSPRRSDGAQREGSKSTPRDTMTCCPECGWTSKRTTAGLAQYALRIHSCDLHRRRQRTAANAAALRARRGTIVRDCPHDGRHTHGTYAAYVIDKCRCTACTDNRTRYEANRRKQDAYGRWQPYVDAEPARQHVRALMAAGMGWQRIARQAGIGNSTVSKLLYGATDRNMPPSRRIRPDAAQRLLAVQLDLADAALVDATGTWRRLQALVAIGWPKAELARRLGRARALQFGRDAVEAQTADQVRALYEELWATRGPSTRAIRHAQKHQWATPLELDDDRIDDPTYTPTLHRLDDMALRRQRKEDIAARRQQVLELTAEGLDPVVIARRLGITRDIVHADRRRTAS